MDLSVDILQLAEKVAPMPGLSTACSLALQIIANVQISMNNNNNNFFVRLQYLAHLVAGNLVNIASHMQGRWDDPGRLRPYLDDFEAVLLDVSKAVTKYSKSGFIAAMINASAREMHFMRLEKRLTDVQKSIFLLLAVDTSVAVNQLHTFLEPERTMEPRSGSLKGQDEVDVQPLVPLVPEDERLRATFSARKSHVSTNLSDRVIHFNDPHIGPTGSSSRTSPPETSNHQLNLDSVPDLTGRIKVVKGPLCAGGFCDVYSGKLTSKGGTETVALKMLRVFSTEIQAVKAKRKFRREISLWCLLQHPHVLPFYGTCEHDGFRLFMVSPWAAGGNSMEYLRQNPSTNRGELLWQTSSALEYLHSGEDAPQIVHGDIKADNVLISATEDVLLCDFGLSRQVEEIIAGSESSKSGSSYAGRGGGHPRFMAPELLTSPKDAYQSTRPTPASDVFAFGLLMLQIYTEKLPFNNLREAQAIIRLANGDLPCRPVEPISLERGCDDHIWTVMTDCWQFEACNRPSIKEVRRRITAPGL